MNSRQNSDATQPQITRRQEAAMAAIRCAMVRGLHDTYSGKLAEGWNTYVVSQMHGCRRKWHADGVQDSSRLIHTSQCSPTQRAKSPPRPMSSQGSELESQNPF